MPASTTRPDICLGLRVRTARAIAVACAGSLDSPHVTLRREIRLWDPKVPPSAAPYHAALELTGAKAEETIRRGGEAVRAASLASLRQLLAELEQQGSVNGIALVVASDMDPAKATNAHIHAHAAEGRLYRQALEEAAAACGVPSATHLEKRLSAEAQQRLGRSEAELKAALVGFGRQLGSPWTAYEKAAALAAWLGLPAAAVGRGKSRQDAMLH